MKLFQRSSIEIVRLRQSFLNFILPSVRRDTGKCVAEIEQKLLNSQNVFCKL